MYDSALLFSEKYELPEKKARNDPGNMMECLFCDSLSPPQKMLLHCCRSDKIIGSLNLCGYGYHFQKRDRGGQFASEFPVRIRYFSKTNRRTKARASRSPVKSGATIPVADGHPGWSNCPSVIASIRPRASTRAAAPDVTSSNVCKAEPAVRNENNRNSRIFCRRDRIGFGIVFRIDYICENNPPTVATGS